MPQKLTQEIIHAAIAGFEAQKQQIDSKIAELRNVRRHRHVAAEAPKLKRKISAASRRRMAMAQKKRWAAIKGRSQAISTAESAPKRRISEEGMKRIIAATKRRWALKRAQEAKAKRTGVGATRTRARNATMLKAA